MCVKIVTRCCHCGEPLTPYFIACNAWRVAALRAGREYLDLPRASECAHLEQEIKPVLSGCPNNDTCPSWLDNLLRGFGDAKNEDREIQLVRDNVAREKYNELEADFACKYFAKKPIPPRQEPCDEASNDNALEHASGESAEIDPEDLFLESLLTNRSEGKEGQPPLTRTTTEEYRDLVVPVWNALYPAMDLGRDSEFCD
ncbi:hypothetical protein QYS62_001393 [Fusarium acuminatum]|uniref:Uncharacterized protein n=1 Tax=Fusarium acuminatum TaxID=5515 RepID=A0ABZ2WJ71_9HYPO